MKKIGPTLVAQCWSNALLKLLTADTETTFILWQINSLFYRSFGKKKHVPVMIICSPLDKLQMVGTY